MRKTILGGASAIAIALATGGAAWAADMPVKASPIAQLFNWSGCYIGGDIGGSWAKNWSDSDGVLEKHSSPYYGGHLGCNVQSGQWVWGAEGDLGTTDNLMRDSDNWWKVRSMGSLRAKLGITVDRVLVYGTAGIGWLGGKSHESSGEFRKFHDTRLVVGGGADYALNNNWILGAKVLGYLGSKADTAEPGDDVSDRLKNVWVATIGLSYKFGTGGKGPVVAKD
jgi:outer membrane immunogenic protein